jgi:fused signal recognition particle receptor
MNWELIKQYLESIPYYDRWAPLLEKINTIITESGLPNPTVNVPLSAILSLLFVWLLVRVVRSRRLGKAVPDEKAAAKITDESAEAGPDKEIPEVDLDDEPEVDFGVETEDYVALEDSEGATPLIGDELDPDLPEMSAEAVEPLAPSEEAPEIEAFEPLEAEIEPEPEPEVEEEPKLSFFQRLSQGLQKTKDGFVGKIEAILSGSSKIDDDLFEDLEEALVTSDIGVQTAYALLEATQEAVDEQEITDPKAIMGLLQSQIQRMLDIDLPPIDPTSKKPFVLLVVGVNGTGKTTTIGKIASQYKNQGLHVVLGAADTFRAAAIEQLEVWANRVGCDIIKQKEGSDPSAVAYDTIDAAQARGADVVIIDTAGRLHTKTNLMNELGKIKRVIQKKMADAPHETMLVLDATTGQNAIVQAREFNKATALSGIILTKLDGTAKGGCIVGIADELKLPIRFIGIGEKIDDLRPFDADEFVKALF